MSLQSILAVAGKDLSHVAVWIDDGLKIATPVVTVLDPPLAPIFNLLESIFNGVTSPVSASALQQIVTSVATTHVLSSATAPSAPPSISLMDFATKLNTLFNTITLTPTK